VPPCSYVYVPYGSGGQQPSGLRDPYGCGQKLFRDEFRDRAFKTEDWYDVELGLKLNTPGQADGELSLSVGGHKESLGGILWRYQEDQLLDNFLVSPFHGGPCTASRESHIHITNLQVQAW